MHIFCFQLHNSCNYSLSAAISLEKIRCFQFCIKLSKVFAQMRTAQSAIIREIHWDELDGMNVGGGVKNPKFRNINPGNDLEFSQRDVDLLVFPDLYPSLSIQHRPLPFSSNTGFKLKHSSLITLLYSVRTYYTVQCTYLLYCTVYIHTLQYSVHIHKSTVYICILYSTVYTQTLQYSVHILYSTLYSVHTYSTVQCTYIL